MHKTLSSRIIGYLLSLILTLIAFLVTLNPDFQSTIPITTTLLLALALLQFIVQSICFLNVWEKEGPPWKLMIYVSTLSIAMVIIVFTIWIIHRLDYNMMFH